MERERREGTDTTFPAERFCVILGSVLIPSQLFLPFTHASGSYSLGVACLKHEDVVLSSEYLGESEAEEC